MFRRADRSPAPSSRDQQILRRVAVRIGVQTGVLVLVAFCLCAGVLLLLVVRAQHNDARVTLRNAAAHADDVTDPPSGVWLVLRSPGGQTQMTPGTPQGLPDQASIGRVSATGGSVTTEVHTPSGEYRVLTVSAPGRIVQAAMSLSGEHAERTRLLEGLAVTGALAVAAAGALGTVAARRSVAPLAAALSRQRTFVADASHELRTPLTHLTTRLQLLDRSLSKADLATARADAEGVRTDASRLAATLDDLLLAAEPADPGSWAVVDVREVAEAVVSAVAPEAARERVTVRLESSEEGEVRVRAPRAALDRVLVALLDNAIRHTPAQGDVCVDVHRSDTKAIVAVADTGSGIPADQAEHIFDRFAHGPSTHSGRRRFGLGLALVADTVDRLGGDIFVDSHPGAGTTMTIQLPLTPKAAGERRRGPRIRRGTRSL